MENPKSNGLKDAVHKAKEWVGKHKTELVILGGVGICFVVSLYLGRKNILREFAWRDSLILNQQDRIMELENLCEIKDKLFSEMISDGLRHRSSLAAQHMADRKLYLSNVDVA